MHVKCMLWFESSLPSHKINRLASDKADKKRAGYYTATTRLGLDWPGVASHSIVSVRGSLIRTLESSMIGPACRNSACRSSCCSRRCLYFEPRQFTTERIELPEPKGCHSQLAPILRFPCQGEAPMVRRFIRQDDSCIKRSSVSCTCGDFSWNGRGWLAVTLRREKPRQYSWNTERRISTYTSCAGELSRVADRYAMPLSMA
jgi:hypothetical protein